MRQIPPFSSSALDMEGPSHLSTLTLLQNLFSASYRIGVEKQVFVLDNNADKKNI